MTDRAVAERLGITPSAVGDKRYVLGIGGLPTKPRRRHGNPHLAAEEKVVLGTGDLIRILSYLDRAGPRPSTPELLSGGAGAGQTGTGSQASTA